MSEQAKITTITDPSTGEAIAPRTLVKALSGDGAAGQLLGFTSSGKVEAVDPPESGVTSFNGRKGAVTSQAGDYTAAMVGLGNVDNTSDLDKPVSTAQQAALNGKADLVEGKVPAGQLPALPYDASGSAAAVDAKLSTHTTNKSNPHGVTSAQIGAVPTSRKINGKALTGDVTLTAQDVGVTDETAVKLGLDPEKDPTVNEAFGGAIDRTNEMPDKIEPVGTVKITRRNDLGEKWLLCNGGNIEYSNYPELSEIMTFENAKSSTSVFGSQGLYASDVYDVGPMIVWYARRYYSNDKGLSVYFYDKSTKKTITGFMGNNEDMQTPAGAYYDKDLDLFFCFYYNYDGMYKYSYKFPTSNNSGVSFQKYTDTKCNVNNFSKVTYSNGSWWVISNDGVLSKNSAFSATGWNKVVSLPAKFASNYSSLRSSFYDDDGYGEIYITSFHNKIENTLSYSSISVFYSRDGGETWSTAEFGTSWSENYRTCTVKKRYGKYYFEHAKPDGSATNSGLQVWTANNYSINMIEISFEDLSFKKLENLGGCPIVSMDENDFFHIAVLMDNGKYNKDAYAVIIAIQKREEYPNPDFSDISKWHVLSSVMSGSSNAYLFQPLTWIDDLLLIGCANGNGSGYYNMGVYSICVQIPIPKISIDNAYTYIKSK